MANPTEGVITSYDHGLHRGFITADNGKIYPFTQAEWRGVHYAPVVKCRVKFDVTDDGLAETVSELRDVPSDEPSMREVAFVLMTMVTLGLLWSMNLPPKRAEEVAPNRDAMVNECNQQAGISTPGYTVTENDLRWLKDCLRRQGLAQ